MSARKFLIYGLFFLCGSAAFATGPLWRITPDVSFGAMSVGFEPVDTLISAASYLGSRGGAYIKAGYGLVVDDDYYLIIPERESALGLFAGYEAYGSTGSTFDPGGASVSDSAYRDYRDYYLRASLDQVLLGDRRHEKGYLALALSDSSRLVAAGAALGEGSAPEAFFSHSLRAALAFNIGSRWPLWDLASLAGSLGSTMELGHSPSRGLWNFAMADATLRFRLPILGRYLYLSAGASARSFLVNLTPDIAIPAWYYGLYSSGSSLGLEADLRSRIAAFNPMLPMALDLGIGATSSTTAASLLALRPLQDLPILRAYGDLLVETGIFGDFRFRAGASYAPGSGKVGFLLAALSATD